jgi:hypothetical protein
MTDSSLARWQGWRAVPRSTWLFLVLAVLYLAVRVVETSFAPLQSLAGVAPLLVVAVIAYVRPEDRRFRWAAWALVGWVVLPLVANRLPELVFRYAPGDWSNAAFLLQDVASLVGDVANTLLIVALALIGMALGGVRSAFGALIVASGVFVALANLTWFFAHPVEDLPLLTLLESVTFTALTAVAWAFVFAAAVDAVRSMLIIGTGLLFANVVVNAVLLWWAPGPGTNFDVLSVILSSLGLAGWLFVALGALRGELVSPRDAGSRSRAARRTTPRPAAG